ncbi:MAG: hypothetical protein NZ651_04745 [Candidatus Bipolaricaulota bacterium]|nr:hypothetical protein [Candidatus Bipolaricaulota bacterium]MDW8127061.1 hypothetical protein [Candidatus Bipolaricaulota bacterium]
MLTVETLSSRLGLSPWQVRRLIYALRPVLKGMVVSAKGRPLEVSPQAIGILERALQLKASGVPLNELASVISEELGESMSNTPADAGGPKNLAQEPAKLLQEVLASKEALIEELRRERDYWRELALKLQAQVEELHRAALPAPKEHRPWWARGILRWLWS